MQGDIGSLRFRLVNRFASAWVSSGGIRVPAPSPYHPTDCRSHRNGPGYGQSHPPNYTLPSTPPVPRTPTPPRSASGSFRRSRPTATPHRPPEKPTGESLIRALPCLGISRNLGSSPARLRMRHQGRCRSVRWLPGIPVKTSLWHRLSPLQTGDDDPMGLKTISSGGHSFPQFPWIRILKQFAAMPHLFHSCQPVLECQTFHSFKFTYIVRYQSQRTGNGLSGNQHIVGTYRRSLGLQACAGISAARSASALEIGTTSNCKEWTFCKLAATRLLLYAPKHNW